jgi:hypothetical protein
VRRAVLAIALVASACGGDETLTSEEYAARLNAACREFAERELRIGDPQTAADLVEDGPEVLQAFEETILEAADSTEAPDEIAGEAALLRRLAHDQRDVLAGLVDAARDRDVPRLSRLAAQNRSLNQEASSTARRVGADACAGS